MAGPIRVSAKGPKQAAVAPQHASFVLGSRPPSLRNPRIKPAIGVTQYGKQLQSQSGVQPISPGFGDTGRTGES